MINTLILKNEYQDERDNPDCLLCCNKSIDFDEYCEEHQQCYECGSNDDCNCLEELSEISYCCGARMDSDVKICYNCKEHAESALDDYLENHPVQIYNGKLIKFENKK